MVTFTCIHICTYSKINWLISRICSTGHMVPWLATKVTFKNIGTCPGLKGTTGYMPRWTAWRGKGENGNGNGDGNGESGPAGAERRREQQIGEVGASGGGRGTAGEKTEKVSRACASVTDVLRVGRCQLYSAPITFVTDVTVDWRRHWGGCHRPTWIW